MQTLLAHKIPKDIELAASSMPLSIAITPTLKSPALPCAEPPTKSTFYRGAQPNCQKPLTQKSHQNKPKDDYMKN